MLFSDLLKFIHTENKRLNSLYLFKTKKEELFAKTVKMVEETGELCNEILGINKIVRKEKWIKYTKQTLADEIADVLITVMLIADNLNVNVEESLKNKIDKINQRYRAKNDM
ncbi:MazG-like family protein [Candidatus Microgenomates bacterium]|nr:MazG-like family protein [Candidatus Microgenomates bacterium]